MGLRIAGAVLLSSVTLVASAPGAQAGGSWLYPDRHHYAVGEAASVRGSFGRGSYQGTVADGPFFAYLVAAAKSFRPGPVPDYAIGEMVVTKSNEYGWVARVAFTMPDVPTGRYSVTYCNRPCTIDGIGDLIGSWSFWIGGTLKEARLTARLEFERYKVEQLRERLERARSLAASLAQSGDVRAGLSTKLNLLEARTSEPQTPPSGSRTAWWMGVAGFALGLATALVLALIRSRWTRAKWASAPDSAATSWESVSQMSEDAIDTREPALRS